MKKLATVVLALGLAAGLSLAQTTGDKAQEGPKKTTKTGATAATATKAKKGHKGGKKSKKGSSGTTSTATPK